MLAYEGHIPLDLPGDTIGRLARYKRFHGMSLDRLGEAMGRDPEQLADCLSGRHMPFRNSLERIERFLEDELRVQDSCHVQQNSMFKTRERAILLNDQNQTKQG